VFSVWLTNVIIVSYSTPQSTSTAASVVRAQHGDRRKVTFE
jgi:hypothetical protein